MRKINLLTKSALVYIAFVAITFAGFMKYLKMKSVNYIDTQTEDFFQYRENRLKRMLEHHANEIEERLCEMRGITPLSSTDTALLSQPPYIRDSLILNPENEEKNLTRLKTINFAAGGKIYSYTMRITIEDFINLRSDLLRSITQTFIFLALLIILFSLFLSGFLMRPFYRILDQMNLYKVGTGVNAKPIKTSTEEFKTLQTLFRHMVSRTEEDYRKLKEYTENMAHELQTPLAIIRNKAENLIADETVMNQHASTIKAIYDETNHLSNLGTTLNLLTKIENGEYSNVKQVEMKPVIERHIDAVKELIGLKSLSIEAQLTSDLTFTIDPFLLDILLKNLLRNAIRYGTNQGPIRITSSNSQLTISNYGAPLAIDPKSIFDRFVSGSSSSSSLGLGLALAKRICDLNQLQLHYAYNGSEHQLSVKKMIP